MKKQYSKLEVIYVPLNSHKVTNSKPEIRRNYVYFFKCTLKLIHSIRCHKISVCKEIIIHLFFLDISSFTIPTVPSGLLYSPGSNTHILFAGLLVLFFFPPLNIFWNWKLEPCFNTECHLGSQLGQWQGKEDFT